MSLRRFVEESNMIEGIFTTTDEQVEAHREFLNSPYTVTVIGLQRLVSVLQPNALLREYEGLDVYVGNHKPIKGGPKVSLELKLLLHDIKHKYLSPYEAHCIYEDLHPFTDGNGRSGRALWYWYMKQLGEQKYVEQLGFLHGFYYQTLDQFHNKKEEKE